MVSEAPTLPLSPKPAPAAEESAGVFVTKKPRKSSRRAGAGANPASPPRRPGGASAAVASPPRPPVASPKSAATSPKSTVTATATATPSAPAPSDSPTAPPAKQAPSPTAGGSGSPKLEAGERKADGSPRVNNWHEDSSPRSDTHAPPLHPNTYPPHTHTHTHTHTGPSPFGNQFPTNPSPNPPMRGGGLGLGGDGGWGAGLLGGAGHPNVGGNGGGNQLPFPGLPGSMAGFRSQPGIGGQGGHLGAMMGPNLNCEGNNNNNNPNGMAGIMGCGNLWGQGGNPMGQLQGQQQGGMGGGIDAQKGDDEARNRGRAKARRGGPGSSGGGGGRANPMVPDDENPAVDAVRYKTKMCKNWEIQGKCPYGPRCLFAHGKKELRTSDKNLELIAEIGRSPSPVRNFYASGHYPKFVKVPVELLLGAKAAAAGKSCAPTAPAPGVVTAFGDRSSPPPLPGMMGNQPMMPNHHLMGGQCGAFHGNGQ